MPPAGLWARAPPSAARVRQQTPRPGERPRAAGRMQRRAPCPHARGPSAGLPRAPRGERAGPLPEFVKAELEGFAGCGDFELGFVRTCCRSCGDELRVPFSCKGRGCCPSCMGRRMAEGAALLVDHVLPAVGYRQWVLSFEGPMAVRLGYDQALLARVAEAFARALMHDMRWEVKARHGLGSVQPLHAGVFTAVQASAATSACTCICTVSSRMPPVSAKLSRSPEPPRGLRSRAVR
jgi:hypothetical protein